MKRELVALCTVALCVNFLLPMGAFADCAFLGDSIPSKVSSEIQPLYEQTRWEYRVNNGNYEKRLWSITYNKWLTDWIIIGPVNP